MWLLRWLALPHCGDMGDSSAVIYLGVSEHREWSSTSRASPGVCLGHAQEMPGLER